MKREPWITLMMIVFTGLMIFLVTTNQFLTLASEYPLITSFLKFFVLASIGDVIGFRMKEKEWGIPPKLFYKAIIWGIIGIVIYLMFQIYPYGVYLLQEDGILPFAGNDIAKAFFISLIMNYTFAPTMMSIHRITDTWLNERAKGHKLSFVDTINTVNWGTFFKFILLRTIPLFWIPAHTITFLLPPQYRIIFAAVLGIVLGLLLSLGNKTKTKGD